MGNSKLTNRLPIVQLPCSAFLAVDQMDRYMLWEAGLTCRISAMKNLAEEITECFRKHVKEFLACESQKQFN